MDELSITLHLQSKINFCFCQDACQCLILHPYITASRTIININCTSCMSGVDPGLGDGGFLNEEAGYKSAIAGPIFRDFT